jgi:hypothetical protein
MSVDPKRTVSRIVSIIIKVLILGTLAVFVFGEAVYLLWNWLMPSLFHLPAITSFWQAIGLLVLSWLLFGGLRGSGPRSGYRRFGHRRMMEHWERMTPQEREKFREWMQSRCGQTSAEAQSKP